MCLFALVSQFIGWLVFEHLTDHLLKLCIGFVAVITAANYWINILRARAKTKPRLGRETSLETRGDMVWPVRHVKFRVFVRRHTGTDFPVAPPPQ